MDHVHYPKCTAQNDCNNHLDSAPRAKRNDCLISPESITQSGKSYNSTHKSGPSNYPKDNELHQALINTPYQSNVDEPNLSFVPNTSSTSSSHQHSAPHQCLTFVSNQDTCSTQSTYAFSLILICQCLLYLGNVNLNLLCLSYRMTMPCRLEKK